MVPLVALTCQKAHQYHLLAGYRHYPRRRYVVGMANLNSLLLHFCYPCVSTNLTRGKFQWLGGKLMDVISAGRGYLQLLFEDGSQEWLGALEIGLCCGLRHIERLANLTEAELRGIA